MKPSVDQPRPDRVPIDDLADPRVAPYRNVRDADLAGRAHAFIVEARFNVQTLLGPGSRFVPESILGTPVALDAVADDLTRVPEGVPVYEASQVVMDEIVGFHIHRGLLALARRAPVPAAEALLDAEGFPRVVVCVEDLTNHDNMGAIFRNAAAFGAGAVCITERCCDPLYRKAVRVSMGHVLRLPFATVPGGAPGVEAMRALGYANIALTPRDSAVTIDDVSSWAAGQGRVALWLGHEGHGLSDPLIDAADRAARIPIAPGVDSLNTAAALAIALHRVAVL